MDASAVADPLLPAAPFLTSAAAFDVLATAVTAAGGRLLACAPVHVHYRPGHELVVRYRADVAGSDGTPERQTLLAGTAVGGPHAGTLHVTTEDEALTVGVWRWPFDPVLPGLATAVTGHLAGRFLGEHMSPPLSPEVVVYRPTERAVVRITDASGRRAYVKVVPPATVAGLVARHEALGNADLPVPRVVASDAAAGLVALSEVVGPTLRELVKGDRGGWPPAAEFLELRRRLARAATDAPARPTRRADAIAHAAMLATVLPAARAQLDHVTEPWRLGAINSGPPVTVHGDLHEAQVIIGDGRITGLLDVDEVGPGDPLDDLATVLGHMRYRQVTTADRGVSSRIAAYADSLRAGFVDEVAPAELDASTAAVLIGLATGPFRVQMEGWQAATTDVLDVATALVGPAAR
jgi:hypothetical protein